MSLIEPFRALVKRFEPPHAPSAKIGNFSPQKKKGVAKITCLMSNHGKLLFFNAFQQKKLIVESIFEEKRAGNFFLFVEPL